MPARIELKGLVLDYPAQETGTASLKLGLLGLLGLGGGSLRPRTFRALDGIDLTITPGMRVGLFGANGAGKSTLLRVMAGIYPPTAGEVRTAGRISTLLGLGAGTSADMTAEDNIRMLMRIDGLAPTPALVDEVWAFTEIDGTFRTMPLRSLSSGMLMRVLFSVATLARADILLLDEWLAVADERFASRAEARLAGFIDAAGIMVFASHNRKLLARVCTHVVTISHGRIIAIDSPRDFLARAPAQPPV